MFSVVGEMLIKKKLNLSTQQRVNSNLAAFDGFFPEAI